MKMASIEEKAKEQTKKIIKVITEMLSSGNQRMLKIQDPIVRYTVLLDRLCSITDFGLAALNHITDDETICQQAREQGNIIKNELTKLMDLIAVANLNPDQVNGSNLKKRSAAHLTGN